jgi:hypothetical protein
VGTPRALVDDAMKREEANHRRARGDVELRKDPAQVRRHRPRADLQYGGDCAVGVASRDAGDLTLARRERYSLARSRPRGSQQQVSIARAEIRGTVLVKAAVLGELERMARRALQLPT